jgi:hypothetical protein
VEQPRPVIFMPLLPRMPWWTEPKPVDMNQIQHQQPQQPSSFDPSKWFNMYTQISGRK